jgi:Phage Mu protein F like protein
MPKMPKDAYAAICLRKQMESEVSFAVHIKKLLKTQGQNCSVAYQYDGGQGAVEEVLKGQTHKWQVLFMGQYALVIQKFSKFTQQQLLGKQFAGRHIKQNFMMRIQTFIAKQGLSQSKAVTDTTIEQARKVINDGQLNGDSVDVIAKSLESQIGGVIADSRARTIARTETHNAATYAMDETAGETESVTGVDITREWTTVEDDRVRGTNPKDEFSHVEADGQQRGVGEPFDVSGEELMRPGDPNGSAGNVINCRCVLQYYASDGSAVDDDDIDDEQGDTNPEDYLGG